MATMRGWQLADVIAASVAGNPDAVALFDGAGRSTLSYGQLRQQVQETADRLTEHGLAPGDVIAVQAKNRVEFVVGLLAAARAGLVVVPLDPALPAPQKRQRLELACARAVLTGPDPTALVDDWPHWSIGSAHWPAAVQRDRPAGIGADDALIMFTSGTTGTPKMVPWTNHSLAVAVTSVVETYGLSSTDATVAVMPLFHGHGLVACLLATLASGGSLMLPAQGRFSAHTFWSDMDAVGATWYTAVPTIHQILLDTPAAGQPSIAGRLRFIRSCSAPLANEVTQQIERVFGAPVLAAYGMTEATHQISSVRPSDAQLVRLTTVGRPTSGITAEIRSGEVWIAGPTVTRGYLGEHGSAEGPEAGWLRTGDLGAIDEHGNLTITGRIKNLINRGGEKVAPEQVEQVLARFPGVSRIGVVGVPDSLYGQRVCAVVMSSDAVDVDALTAFARAHLAPFEVPEHILVTSTLPTTAKGDLDRVRLADDVVATWSEGSHAR
ncbi:acyl-CoA synthetase [Mycolicibacterium confluentis]|uniref:Acyl-CoA synthetase n=2 Tax=Mycolicibacterium confluentis TaxID=28047 RepID=A0A7I7XWM9_9MYCO|nr:acyl-CoA synthetase [Mycolicibacterium confluentis]